MDTDPGLPDSNDIPGWDKVDALALALMEPRGLSATAAEAKKIIDAYHALSDYDKQPVRFQRQVHQRPLRGRFGRIRQQSLRGQVSLEKMRK